ncbi:MAG TPA: hypothetical protein VFA76_13065 [Terriglobales bacterium]|nr:hypothetical protein [Terriglobales bacterium]
MTIRNFFRVTSSAAILTLSGSLLASAECMAIQEAARHIGDTACVIGEVVGVNESHTGTTFINFCEDYRKCPFSVVVFARDLRNLGDVRELVGKSIEIHGQIREYDGRPEIVLNQTRQLKGDTGRLPPVPKEFDVERRGHYSAGKFRPGKKPRTKKASKRKIPGDSVAFPDADADDGASPGANRPDKPNVPE